jgi:hypothetical protein
VKGGPRDGIARGTIHRRRLMNWRNCNSLHPINNSLRRLSLPRLPQSQDLPRSSLHYVEWMLDLYRITKRATEPADMNRETKTTSGAD